MKLSGEYTIGFGTDKNNPARYTVAEDAKIFKIDTDGVITAVSLKSITVNTDTCALIGKQADYACFDSMGEVVEVTTTKD